MKIKDSLGAVIVQASLGRGCSRDGKSAIKISEERIWLVWRVWKPRAKIRARISGTS